MIETLLATLSVLSGIFSAWAKGCVDVSVQMLLRKAT
jgi:hypothetical protein